MTNRNVGQASVGDAQKTAPRETLEHRLRNRIAVWASDERACRDGERNAGLQENWEEAIRFREAADTLETVVREARALLTDGAPSRQLGSTGTQSREEGEHEQ